MKPTDKIILVTGAGATITYPTVTSGKVYTKDYSSLSSVGSTLIILDFSHFFKLFHILFEKKGILFTGFLIKKSKYFRNFFQQLNCVFLRTPET